MSVSFTYNLVLKRSETKKIELPYLKSSALLLNNFSVTSDYKTFDIQIKGKETIVSYGEAVFYQSNTFDLSSQIAQIVDSDTLIMTVKNLCTGKEANTVNISIKLNYKKAEGNIIYNQIYINLNAEGLSNILEDVRNAGHHITKIIWTSPEKLSTLELRPQFESEPQWLEAKTYMSDKQNQIVMDLSDDSFDPEFIDQLKYYTMVIPDNLTKLGVIIYGYVN